MNIQQNFDMYNEGYVLNMYPQAFDYVQSVAKQFRKEKEKTMKITKRDWIYLMDWVSGEFINSVEGKTYYKYVVLPSLVSVPKKEKVDIKLAFSSKTGIKQTTVWEERVLNTPIVESLMGKDARIAMLGVAVNSFSFSVGELANILGVSVLSMFVAEEKISANGKKYLAYKVSPDYPEIGVAKKGKPWDVSDWSLNIRIGARLPKEVFVWAWETVKKQFSKSMDFTVANVIPGYPDWQLNKKDGRIVFLIGLEGISFPKMGRDVIYRAGKDMYALPDGEVAKGLTINLVKPASLTNTGKAFRESMYDDSVKIPKDLDGCFYIKPEVAKQYGWPLTFIGRGTIKTDKGVALVKGKAFVTDYVPGPKGEELPYPEGADVFSNFENVKWVGIEKEGNYTLDCLFPFRDKEKDEVGAQKRKLSVVTSPLSLGKFENYVPEVVHPVLEEKVFQVKEDLESLMVGDFSGLAKMIDDPEVTNGKIVEQVATLMMLGFGSNESSKSVYETLMKKVRSGQVSGHWANAIIMACVPAGEVWMSHTTAAAYAKEGFIVDGLLGCGRYPFASHQSFGSYTPVAKDRGWLPDGTLVFSVFDAIGMSMDSDDEVMVSIPFSPYRGAIMGEEIVTARNIEALDLNSLHWTEVYFGGAKASGLIGTIFNAMASAIGINDMALAKRLGSYLDIAAQAVKKPYDLSPIWVDIEAASKGFDKVEEVNSYREAICKITIKKDYANSIEKAFGVTMPSLREFTNSTVGHVVDWVNVPTEWIDAMKGKATSLANLPAGRPIELGKQLVGGAKKVFIERLEAGNFEGALMGYLKAATSIKLALRSHLMGMSDKPTAKELKAQQILEFAMANLDPWILTMAVRVLLCDKA